MTREKSRGLNSYPSFKAIHRPVTTLLKLPFPSKCLHLPKNLPNLTPIQKHIEMLNQRLPFQPFLKISTKHEMKYSHSWDFDYAVPGVVFYRVGDGAGLINLV